MLCFNCNNDIPDDCAFCPRCGIALSQSDSPPIQAVIPQSGTASGMAIAAMVIGIVGVVSPFLGIILGPISIFLSIKEFKKIKTGLSTQVSKTFALVGLILGIIATAIALIMLLFFAVIMIPDIFSERYHSKVSHTQTELRSCATALEAYYIDNNAYPQPEYDFQHNSVLPHNLSTPVAYVTKLPNDSFSDDGKQRFQYYTGEIQSIDTTISYWIIASPGPNRKMDIEVTQYNLQYPYWGKNYIILKSYDPTNGANSQGDIIRFGPE
ncbi:MAG: type II secretion system protein GspG [bacterium]